MKVCDAQSFSCEQLANAARTRQVMSKQQLKDAAAAQHAAATRGAAGVDWEATSSEAFERELSERRHLAGIINIEKAIYKHWMVQSLRTERRILEVPAARTRQTEILPSLFPTAVLQLGYRPCNSGSGSATRRAALQLVLGQPPCSTGGFDSGFAARPEGWWGGAASGAAAACMRAVRHCATRRCSVSRRWVCEL